MRRLKKNEQTMSSRRVRGPDRPKPARSVREDHAPVRVKNRLLELLPPAILAQLTPHLERIHLHHREVLFRAHEPLRMVYFPETAVISLISNLESGESLEVGLVGRDGLAGTAVFPGITMMSCDAVVQIQGVAHRISADVLRAAVLTDETLYSTLGRFAQVLLVRSMQMSVCNMFHSVEQRCVRWLLTARSVMTSMWGQHLNQTKGTPHALARAFNTAGGRSRKGRKAEPSCDRASRRGCPGDARITDSHPASPCGNSPIPPRSPYGRRRRRLNSPAGLPGRTVSTCGTARASPFIWSRSTVHEQSGHVQPLRSQ